jgi:phenylalanyl-tRNA synthetase beta chain
VALRRYLALLSAYGQLGSAELLRPAGPTAATQPIRLAQREIGRLGGLTIEPGAAVAILASLGLDARLEDGAIIVATPPWWRSDLAHPVDLVEEIVRIVGYEQVAPVALPPLAPRGPEPSAWAQEEQLRALLCAWGYDEVILDSFLLERAGGLAERPDTLRVENPPAGLGALRPALLPNMLAAARHLPLLAPRRQLYEIGHVFRCGAEGPAEDRAAAWLLLRGPGQARWEEGATDELYRLKAEALAVLGALGVGVAAEEAGGLPFPFVAGEGVRLLGADGRLVGVVGALDQRAYGTTPAQAAYGAEILLPPYTAGEPASAGRVRRQAERVDLSATLGPGVTAAALRRAIAGAIGTDALELTLIDVYAGQGAGAATSVTFRLIYDAGRGAPQAVWEQLRGQIEAALDVQVRG